MLKVLVVGGAGFIGSHMVKLLGQHNCSITVLDDLSYGHRDAVLFGEFIEGSIADRELLNEIFQRQKFDAVMHFASFIQVGESVFNPGIYYENNVSNSLNLLNAMINGGVNNFIFSSTAAVYGDPKQPQIDEFHPLKPLNPYGWSKLMVEQIVRDFEVAHGLKFSCLRYFNAAGADIDGQLGERHFPETHLIPLVLQVASNRRPNISIFGNDYDTPDGTCIRDYVHVADICEAHWLALQALIKGNKSQSYNLGNGDGFSVKDVISAAKYVTGQQIPIKEEPRRKGDPARLVANSELARNELGWRPKYPDLNAIIESAWQWEKQKNH
jgi:UDP-glucose 4-epimerase